MAPIVSLITVYYNTPDELLKLSASIRRFCAENSYEWIIADNHSGQDLSGRLENAKYLRLSENFGFARASNIAAAVALAPLLFFVNPDCEMISDCVTPLVAAMQHTDVAGPQVLNTDQSIQLSFGPNLSIGAELRQKLMMRYEHTSFVQNRLRNRGVFHPDYVSGCALLIRADLFRQLGGFDENFFLYEEDVDLCERVKQRGGTILYVPDAKIIHHRNRSTEKNSHRARAEYRKSQLYYYRKHKGKFQQALIGLFDLLRK